MASPAETRAALAAAGFGDIELRDRSTWYADLARREHAALSGEWRATLVARIGEARTVHFIANWRQLVTVLERGELLPTHLLARRRAVAAASDRSRSNPTVAVSRGRQDADDKRSTASVCLLRPVPVAHLPACGKRR